MSLHHLGGQGDRSRGERFLRDFHELRDARSKFRRRLGRAAVGGGDAASHGGGEGGRRGGAGGRSLADGGGLVRRNLRAAVCFGFNGLAVVHLEDVLLEVPDPVLLHRERTVKLHLAESDGARG